MYYKIDFKRIVVNKTANYVSNQEVPNPVEATKTDCFGCVSI